jgi:hypothetical protein
MAMMDYPRPPGTSLVEHEAYQHPAETDQTSRGVASAGDRPPPEPMSEDEFNGAVRTLIDNARSLMKEWIEPQTERAWRYYQGSVDQNPMGLIGRDKDTDEQVFEGSAAVMTECRDQVQMLIPEIYRVLAANEEAIEFQPNGPEDEKYVAQVNDYIRYIFWDQNQGEQITKDALLEWCVKYCAFRVWRENSYKERVSRHEGLDELQVSMLEQDPNIRIEGLQEVQTAVSVPTMQPDGTMVYAEQAIPLYNVDCRYYEPYGKTKVALIPQDELLVDLEAQTIEGATVLGIDCERRAGDLIAMGLDPELVKQHAGKGLRRASDNTSVRRARSGSGMALSRVHRDTPDDALHWCRVVDARVLVDADGDGIAEPYRIIALGDPLTIAYSAEDPGSDTIVVGSPFPIPHQLIGQGIVEVNIDLQEIDTSIMRRALDNYARTINPRPAVSGAVEDTWDDLLSWFGGPINLGVNGKIDWLNVPFHGHDAMALLGYFEQRRTLRTGISPAAMGLDPAALKGQTVESAAGILAGPQSRVEGLAREFATRIYRPLFKALLEITTKFQDRAEVIRLRNEFVSVDPRGWSAEMDVKVDVGLGTGSRIERIAVNNMILQKLELLAVAKSPLFDIKKYHAALSDMIVAMGRKDPSRYLPDPESPEFAEAAQRQQQEQQQAIEQQAQLQAQVEAAVEQAKQSARAEAEAQLERVRAELERVAKERELAIEGSQKAGEIQLQGAVEARLLALEQMWKAKLLEIEARFEAQLMRIKGEEDQKVAKARPQPPGSANANVRRPA